MKIIVENEEQKRAVIQVLWATCEYVPWESIHVDEELREIAED